MNNQFYIPPKSLVGSGSLHQGGRELQSLGFKKALIVTCKPIIESKLIESLIITLDENNIGFEVYDKTKPKADFDNVRDALELYSKTSCDFVISLGGNSTRSCAKGVSLMMELDTEGNYISMGSIPLVSINVTSFMTNEIPLFTRKVLRGNEEILVDENTTPILTITDPELLSVISNKIFGAIGVDALRHAIQAYTSSNSTAITDSCAYQSIKILGKHLLTLIKGSRSDELLEEVTYANYLAGIAYNNTILDKLSKKRGGEEKKDEKFIEEEIEKKMSEVALAIGGDLDTLREKNPTIFIIETLKNYSELVGLPSGMSKDPNFIYSQNNLDTY